MENAFANRNGKKTAKTPVMLTMLLILAALILSGCGSEKNPQAFELAPLSEMHPFVQTESVSVQQAYQFAHANPEILKQFPCYCGCGGMGHTSNYACYINEQEGELLFDSHALGCSICVDITQDVMRLMNDGQSLADIQQFVDDKYSKFGPSNMP